MKVILVLITLLKVLCQDNKLTISNIMMVFLVESVNITQESNYHNIITDIIIR
jgi:hypothetical protein